MQSKLPIYQCLIDDDLTSDLQVKYIALVNQPAIERNFMAFEKSKMKFSTDSAKRIISGPVMIADMLIYRNMDPIGEFYTTFDANTITHIMQKFFKQGFVRNFNLDHNEDETTNQITIFESFQTNKERGILPPKGFEDVANGSWFISAKVDDDNAWSKVEDGTFKGFSVEGIFAQMKISQTKMSSEDILEKIATLLSQLDLDNI